MTDRTLALPAEVAYGLALSRLGTLARTHGDAAQALAMHNYALLLLRAPSGSADVAARLLPLQLGVLLETARDLVRLGRRADGVAMLTEIVRMLDAEVPDDFPELGDAYFELATLTHDDDEARRLRERGDAMRRHRDADGTDATAAGEEQSQPPRTR